MSHNAEQITQTIYVTLDSENPAPQLVLDFDGIIVDAKIILFTEGSPTLSATTTLLYEQTQTTRNFVCFMPDSYQSYTIPDLENIEVQSGDIFSFSVNEPSCVCQFALDCYIPGVLPGQTVMYLDEPPNDDLQDVEAEITT